MKIVSDGKNYTGVERRTSEERRVSVDQRASIRLDETGGDRRESMGRRSNDEHLEIFE